MAELDFFLTKEETNALLIHIQSAGYTFIPDIHYADENVLFLSQIEDIESYSLKTRGFFLVNNVYTKEGLKMNFFIRENKKIFFISQGYGGPYLDLLLPITFERDGTVYYSEGFIAKNIRYYHAPGDPIEDVDSSLNKAYQEICKYIKKNTQVIRSTIGRTYRISNAVLKEVESGSKLVGFSDIINAV